MFLEDTWGLKSLSSQLLPKFQLNSAVRFVSLMPIHDITEWQILSFVSVKILKRFRVRCSKWRLWGLFSPFPLTLLVQSEPLRLAHHECFYVDLMFVNLWRRRPASRTLAADVLISADRSCPWLTWGVGILKCLKSVSLCVINFCSLLWNMGLLPQQVVSDIGQKNRSLVRLSYT